jgi:AraC-like DNA-binding protein/CheY-like chemotaxis protein
MNKISVIIVDDDFSSRNTIKNFLRESRCYFPVSDFSGAAAALVWLRENRADIALCDMNMPNIDGIEFITEALKLCPDMRFLAVSAYSDFRYLRECMVHSVEDYLLKHELTACLLINTLDKIKEKYNITPSPVSPAGAFHIIESGPMFTAEYIRSLASSGAVNFTAGAVIPAVISPDYNGNLFPDHARFPGDAAYAVRDIICSVIDNRFSYLMHMSPSFQFALLLSFDGGENNAALLNRTRSFFLAVRDKALRLLNVTLTIGHYPALLKLEDAMKLFDCLQFIGQRKLYLPEGGFFLLGETEGEFSDRYVLPAYLGEQIKTFADLGDFSALKKCIRGVFAGFLEKRAGRDRVIETCSRLCEIIRAAFPPCGAEEPPVNFDRYEFIGQFEKALSDFVDRVRGQGGAAAPSYSTAVSRTLSYIEEHHAEEISLESCAADVGMSYAHLSRIFKKETSCPFSEYLTRFRVSRAKILLAEKKMPIKQIAGETGFTNYNYFFKVFKEVEGITPVEYADSANQ